MIITIDGPAGAGKSSVARELAARLGFRFLDTGAMYRTVALAVLRRQMDWHDMPAVVEVARAIRLDLDEHGVYLDGENVSDAIRATEVSEVVHFVADHPTVRELLVEQQRRIASAGNYVTEGRDQGTVAFPNADCKFYLTACPEERAERRWRELQARGDVISLEQVLRQQNERDHRDQSRTVGRLVAADDAWEVCTDGMTAEHVVHHLEQTVRERCKLGVASNACSSGSPGGASTSSSRE